MKLLRKTGEHKKFWKNRVIDWDKEYLKTWEHPHRTLLSGVLGKLPWVSLMEIGCGGGANLMNIVTNLPGKQVGGIDINKDAIDLAEKTFKGGYFKVSSADDIMMSDKSTDVILSDMTLIYVSPKDINKYIREIKRVARKYVVFCEFHSASWLQRLKLKWSSGYNAHNYIKTLTKHGFYDMIKVKLSEEDWPGGNPQKTFAWIFVAKVPKK